MNHLPSSTARSIRQLRHKKYRFEQRRFAVEGFKSIEALIDSDYEVQFVVGTYAFLETHGHKCSEKGAKLFQAEEELLISLGSFQTNSAGLAVATLPQNSRFKILPNERVLALDAIRDPGNLGTILRVADWYGIQKILCSLSTVDMYNPKVLQASMGSFTQVNVYYTDLAAYFQEHNVSPVWGASLKGENVHQVGFSKASGALVVGNEAHGISEEVLPYITQTLSIPRFGRAESLNAAVATAVLCDHWQKALTS